MDSDAEERRLAALCRYDVLDTPPEESFDRITRLAKSIMNTATAAVTLIDRDRQWFKSRQGMDGTETPRNVSFCTHTIQRDVPMVVCDARADPRFRDNPYVVGEPWVRFYMGVPLSTPDGYNIGALCAVDDKPHQPTEDQVAMLQDLARIVMDELELRQMATTDSLTGALTRRAFLHSAAHELEQMRRYGHTMSAVMLDVDHFKRVNDRYGHPTGDLVLRSIVSHCREIMRRADVLGRLGGEEFAILLPETDLSGAAAIAERLRHGVEATPIEAGDATVRVTISLGVAALESAEQGVERVLAAADAALYEAKTTGRNRVVLADSPVAA